MPNKRQALAYAAALVALLAVFGLYTQPEFLITLADQLWACFYRESPPACADARSVHPGIAQRQRASGHRATRILGVGSGGS